MNKLYLAATLFSFAFVGSMIGMVFTLAQNEYLKAAICLINAAIMLALLKPLIKMMRRS